MKLLLLSFLFISSTCINAQWMNDFRESQKLALTTNKLLLVDFTASWCGPCKKMDSDVWSKSEVQELMNAFVPVKLNFDLEKGLNNLYGVTSIPRILIMDGNGKVIYQGIGYKAKDEILSVLNEYRFDMKYLRERLINYYKKKKDFKSAFSLGRDYQYFAIAVDKKNRNDFLQVSDQYLKEAKKYLKKSDLKLKEDYKERMMMLEIQRLIIQNKPEKALKRLDKLSYDKLSKINQPFYDFLKYQSYRLLNDDKMIQYETKLADSYRSKLSLFEKI